MFNYTGAQDVGGPCIGVERTDMTGSWCAGQDGETPLDIAEGEAVKKLLQEVRTPGPSPNLWLSTQPGSAFDSTIANNALNKMRRALI